MPDSYLNKTSVEELDLSKCSETVFIKSELNNLLYITKIKLPKVIETIPRLKLSKNIELKEIDIPENVSDIGANAFTNCLNLKKVNFLSNCRELEISENVFYGDYLLNELSFKNQNVYIHGYAFNNSGVKKYFLKKGKNNPFL